MQSLYLTLLVQGTPPSQPALHLSLKEKQEMQARLFAGLPGLPELCLFLLVLLHAALQSGNKQQAQAKFYSGVSALLKRPDLKLQ